MSVSRVFTPTRPIRNASRAAALALVVVSAMAGAGAGASAAERTASDDRATVSSPRTLRPVAARPRVKVSLRAPRGVISGEGFVVRGRVEHSRTRAKVLLKQRLDGATGWSTVKKTRANKRGVFSLRVRMDDTSRSYKACAKKKCSKSRHVTSRPAPPPPPSGGAMDYSWTRASDGASFSARVSDLFVEDIGYNTLDQQLGEAKIFFSINGSGEITNHTPGRNSSPDFTQVAPVFPMSSAFCQNATVSATLGGRYRMDPLEVSTTEASSGWDSNLVDTSYCVAATARGSGVDTLAPGATGYQSYDETAFGGSADYYVYVPEPVMATVMAELRQPAFWVLQRGTGSAGVQREYGLGVCHFGIAVVATSPEGAAVCAQGVQ